MTPASMLPSSENLHPTPNAPRSSTRQSIASFNSHEPSLNSPDAHTGCPSNKRSISLVGPPPTNLLTGRIRKLSKQNLGGSEVRMNAGQNGSGGSSVGGSSASLLPQIRLAVKYQSIDVLPLECYDELRKFTVEKSTEFVEYLEPLLSTKRKEEIARCLVNIHEKAPESNIVAFLGPLIDRELNSYDNLSLLLRSNSIASKAVESYIKLVGAEYLQQLLQGFIENFLTSNEDLEVDPSRLTTEALSTASDGATSVSLTAVKANLLQRNQISLTNAVRVVWQRLQNSLNYFPVDLRETLASIRQTVEQRHGQDVGDQLVSGCLFLRYICPALHGPTLFGLINALPEDPRVSRNLTLLAKVLQTIANFSHFEAKENYMRFLNAFVQSMQEEMHLFLRAVSTKNDEYGEAEIWGKKKNIASNCHNSIDLGYELTVLYRHLTAILEDHPKVPESLVELPNILESITHMFLTPPIRRSASNLAKSLRSATTTALETAAPSRTAAFRFHSTVTPPSLNGLQITPAEQPATPVSFYTPSCDYTSKCSSPRGQQRSSFEASSPSSTGISRQQVFFGDAFETGGETSRGTDLESISEAEAQTSPPLTEASPSLKLNSPTRATSSCGHHRSTSAQRHEKTYASECRRRYKEVDGCDLGHGDGVAVTANTLTSSPPQKWSSGPELHADSPVVLNFPPPPPALPQQQKDGGLGGSSTNIRMGTRAIRMSRERGLTGNLETGAPIRGDEERRGSTHLSTVPVILQCETSGVASDRTATSAAHADGSVLSVDSTASYESSSASSSSCLSMMPHVNNANANANGGGQGVFVAENSQYFELLSERNASSVMQRGTGLANTNSNSNDPALLSRVHHLLFGGGCSGNDYQNVRGFVRTIPPMATTVIKKTGELQEQGEVDLRQMSNKIYHTETTNLEALQQRLREMEEHLNQERRDIQKAVASNMRLMESQERCINELIEEINRLQSLRGGGTTTNPLNSPVQFSTTISDRSAIRASASSSPLLPPPVQQRQPQQQSPTKPWW